MAYSGRLDFRVIGNAAAQWKRLALFFYFQVFILSLRWRLLARKPCEPRLMLVRYVN
jgi:hypothetical protein